jgi:membrane fusion protein (multidrug efflux system)
VPEAAQTKPNQQENAPPAPYPESRAARTRSYFRRRPRAKWALPVIFLLFVAAGYALWRYFSSRESTDDAQVDVHLAPISPRVSGQVAAVNVADNQFVPAGAVLVQIDPRDYQVMLENAQAELAAAVQAAGQARLAIPITSRTATSNLSSANARLVGAQAGRTAAEKQVRSAEAQLEAARANLRQAEANHEKAARDLARYRELVIKDEISLQQYDAAKAAEAATRAAVESARADVNRAEQGVRTAEAQLIQADAAVEQARAGVRAAQTAPDQIASSRAQYKNAQARSQQAKALVDQAELNLQYTAVRAPVAGAVGNKTVQVGQVVQPGQTLMAIVPLEDVYITANFKETQLHYMRPGQRAAVSVDTYGGRKYTARVQSISPATGEKFSLLPPENATGNFVKVVQRIPVKIVVDRGQDPEHLLRPGMSVEVTVIIK